MIATATEFRRLRLNDDPAEYGRAAADEAPDTVWLEIVALWPDMREWVAHNKTVPISVLELLASDSDPSVRHAVAMKRKLPESLQLLLARDQDDSVRMRICLNPKIERHVLEFLARDSWDEIRENARRRLAEL